MQTQTGTSHPTKLLEYDKDVTGAEETPGIDYVHGEELDDFREEWYEAIEAMTRAEPHLLTKTREDLEPAVRERRIVVAVDRTSGDKVVGCIVLWPLCEDESGQMWYELGTFLVIPSYRYGRAGLPIGDVMYHHLLAQNQEKNILGTTTNVHAIHTGMRHGMQMISFRRLPPAIHHATCVCPLEKTGTRNNLRCNIKDLACRVRVSTPTWERMGSPERLPFP